MISIELTDFILVLVYFILLSFDLPLTKIFNDLQQKSLEWLFQQGEKKYLQARYHLFVSRLRQLKDRTIYESRTVSIPYVH